jgi:23S rRNA pseudouridine1911/1915/1917 synthase
MSTKPPLDISQTPLSVIDSDHGQADPADPSLTEVRQVQVGADLHGERLDRALAVLLPEFSRSHLQALITQGEVTEASGAARAKPSVRVKAGQVFHVLLRPTEESQAYTPEPMSLHSVFCDGSLRVIDKPAGLVVHPAPGHWSGTLLNGLLALDELSRVLPRAGIVHRLDKDTSGLMMVARTRASMDALVSAIASRHVKREYVALVHGRWSEPGVTTLDGSIGRDPSNRLRMAVLNEHQHAAKTAMTHVRCLHQGTDHALLHCQLETGRTHQIRVHLAHHGHPLVGDALYGGKPVQAMTRQALHAWRLSLNHPIDGQPLSWFSPPPEDFLQVCQQLGLGYNFSQ